MISKLDTTRVRFTMFLSSVSTNNMPFQATAPTKCGIACFTFIRFLPRVCSYMPVPATLTFKTGAAYVTFIRFLARMNASMNVQVNNP